MKDKTMSKPIEEYYLHDHGDGNGWEVVSKGPGKFGLINTSHTNVREGVIQLDIEQYFHGVLNSIDNSTFMLSPEEARDIGLALIQCAEQGEGDAIQARKDRQLERV